MLEQVLMDILRFHLFRTDDADINEVEAVFWMRLFEVLMEGAW